MIAIFNSSRRVSLRHGFLTSLALGMLFIPTLTIAQPNKAIAEEIEWTWDVRPQHVDTQLPNVLLLGDSITRNYFPQVTKDLAGIANVYLMASSTSVGDSRLPQQIAEFAALQGSPSRWFISTTACTAGVIRNLNLRVDSHSSWLLFLRFPVVENLSGQTLHPSSLRRLRALAIHVSTQETL
jgi:hypothetical protein